MKDEIKQMGEDIKSGLIWMGFFIMWGLVSI